MNETLSGEFLRDEKVATLHQMNPTKALGPVGMPPLFYHKYWPIMGYLIIKAAIQVLNTGHFPENLNHSFLTLIPKKIWAIKEVDFLPY